jgi:hypothetical protein
MVVTVLVVPMRPEVGLVLWRACIRSNGKQQHSGDCHGTGNGKKAAHVWITPGVVVVSATIPCIQLFLKPFWKIGIGVNLS